MDSKRLDALLEDALAPVSVPPQLQLQLNQKLVSARRKRLTVYRFTKVVSSCAAVFICALTVLANFNSDTRNFTYNIPGLGSFARLITFTSPEASVQERDINSPVLISEEENPSPAIPETPDGPSPRGLMAPPLLYTLFYEGYDFSELTQEIHRQIASSSDVSYYTDEEYKFTNLSGHEEYRIDENGSLIIIFQAGAIAPEEYGICEFNVGKPDGMLIPE